MNKSIIFVTGLSGAGRSEVMKALEDLDFFCVDNLPLALLSDLSKLSNSSEEPKQRLAVSLDVRGNDFFTGFLSTIDNLENSALSNTILFLDCADNVLVRRYSETRRRHPIHESESLLECIAKERTLLSEIRARADYVLDTSSIKTHELRNRIGKLILNRDVSSDIIINVMSFGYKNGVPLDADFMFDVRFLDNPYYKSELRSKTGLDIDVADYVFSQTEAEDIIENISNLMKRLIPLHSTAGKTSLTIAIGCTGGQHRSVAITEQLSKILSKKFSSVTAIHRDIK
ncbi:RNase adapter RapZ [Amylibacter sp.]|nr:RNase adapter RapZ [Amylibacter sp.]MDB2538082.1 RNase adapter RapZ [Amylibacter sp.]MDB4008336.1 RNase adapter RapZ [Amylibacter sp.]MDB4078204.1 RNase adapter RapZ [Amylibacter sp.]MDB9697719.1 RNase adapter RapZ [Amylibacter sp.]